MFELAVPLSKVHETPVEMPPGFRDRHIDFANMWVRAWDHRAPSVPNGENSGHNYRLYPLEHTHAVGVYVFGVKEDMTPQCYEPSFRIVLDMHHGTYQVTDVSLHWESLVEDLEPSELPVAIFNFL